jgi:hypothetical protein
MRSDELIDHTGGNRRRHNQMNTILYDNGFSFNCSLDDLIRAVDGCARAGKFQHNGSFASFPMRASHDETFVVTVPLWSCAYNYMVRSFA